MASCGKRLLKIYKTKLLNCGHQVETHPLENPELEFFFLFEQPCFLIEYKQVL
jgi:hypothetical protein